jgi:hypothetical protein
VCGTGCRKSAEEGGTCHEDWRDNPFQVVHFLLLSMRKASYAVMELTATSHIFSLMTVLDNV